MSWYKYNLAWHYWYMQSFMEELTVTGQHVLKEGNSCPFLFVPLSFLLPSHEVSNL